MLRFLRRRPSAAIERLKHEQGHQALRYLTTGVGVFYAVMMGMHLFFLPHPANLVMFAVSLAASCSFFCMRMCSTWIGAAAERTRSFEAIVMTILSVVTIVHAVVHPDASIATTLSLVVIAAGLVVHSTMTLVGIILLCMAGVSYALMGPNTGSDMIAHYSFHFFFSALLASLAYAIRMTQIRHRAANELRRIRAIQRLERQQELLKATSIRAEKAALQADGANRAKSQFLANMSHELRTPLNAILGFSELMEHRIFGDLGDKRYGEYAQHIHSSGGFLLKLVNDILDLSKIEANKFEVFPEPVRLSEALNETASMIAPQADQRQVEFRVSDVPEDATVMADPRALQQILLNLISNGVKFTEPGGSVSVQVANDMDRWCIAVSDTGIGIPEEDLPNVLAPFGQVANAMTRQQDGTGLGLPLAKSLTEIMSGDFKLESIVGEGTKVSIAFPLHIQQENHVDTSAA
ncbi:hypothetical protein NBRC116588_30750 [Pyruvatibacter sp. HU-CL02332]|uniref:sensor histidine kinase n=1 Tax=Pyruvatibacter sp. HU-CL02332 TaxID=3127650 RepID=UPI0031041434